MGDITDSEKNTNEPATRPYGITFVASGRTTVTVEATSVGEAMAVAQREYAGRAFLVPRLEIECAEWDELDAEGQPSAGVSYRVGSCEGCGRPIPDGEDYASDDEGCYTCSSCLPPESEQAERSS